jgi:hypothetical protein
VLQKSVDLANPLINPSSSKPAELKFSHPLSSRHTTSPLHASLHLCLHLILIYEDVSNGENASRYRDRMSENPPTALWQSA